MTAGTGASDNQQLVRDSFAAMGPSLQAFKDNYRERLADDVVWESVGHPVRNGLPACLDYLDELNSRTGMECCTIEVLYLAAEGDVVLSERIDTMCRADGRPIQSFRIMGAIEISGGKITRYTDYFDTGAAGPAAPSDRSQTFEQAAPPTDPPSSASWLEWADTLPATRAIGLTCVSLDAQQVRMVLSESVWPRNPNGALHGGLVLAAADQTMGVAAMAAQEPGSFTATASINIDYHAPALPPVTFEATVTRRGRTLTFVEASAIAADGLTCARATGVWSVRRVPSTKSEQT